MFGCAGSSLPFWLSLVVLCGLLIAETSLVTERGLYGMGTSVVVVQWAQLPCGMWDLPGPGIKPMSAALAGRFPTSGPPGKPLSLPFQWAFPDVPSNQLLTYCVPSIYERNSEMQFLSKVYFPVLLLRKKGKMAMAETSSRFCHKEKLPNR